jgi:hypothetical protein
LGNLQNQKEIEAEEREIIRIKESLITTVFLKYEWLFRQLSKPPSGYLMSNPDYIPPLAIMRITLESLKLGMPTFYKGRHNDLMASLISGYFSKGLHNHETTFSSFMSTFMYYIEKDEDNRHLLAFKMLDEEN